MSIVSVSTCRVVALACMWASAVAAQPAAPPTAPAWDVSNGRAVVVCPLTIGGRFEAKTSAVTGRITVAGEARELGGAFSVDLRSLDTGIALRNQHLRDNYLEVSRGPGYDTAVLSELILDSPPPGPGRSATVGFRGVLSLHGNGRPVTGTAHVTHKRETLEVRARFPLKIDAYEIARPSYLGVGVINQIEVDVRATLKPEAARPSGSR